VRTRLLHHLDHLLRFQGEVRSTLRLHDPCSDDSGDVGVQLVRRLEGGHRAARTGEGEQQGLDHLVAPVGREDVLRMDAVVIGESRSQTTGGSIRVPIPGDPGDLPRQSLDEFRGWRQGRFIGVQPDPDVDLR
jgi:hypothetical protein